MKSTVIRTLALCLALSCISVPAFAANNSALSWRQGLEAESAVREAVQPQTTVLATNTQNQRKS